MLLSTWVWLIGIERGGWQPWLGYAVIAHISLHSHLLTLLIWPIHFLWFCIAWPQCKERWRGYGAALLGFGLPYVAALFAIPLIIEQATSPVAWIWRMTISSQKLTGFSFTPIQEMMRQLLLNHSRGFMPPGELIWLSPIFFLGLAGLLFGVVELQSFPRLYLPGLSNSRRTLMLFSWLFGPIALIYLLSLRQPIFTDRYIIWIAPAALIFLALGVLVVWKNAAFLSKPLSIILILYVTGFWLYAGWQQKEKTVNLYFLVKA